MKNLLYKLLVLPLACLLVVLPVTGCATNQANINVAVTDIYKWAPVVSSDATALLTDVASFNPSDAALIQTLITQIQSDVAPLQSLCKAYLAHPTAGVLAQIAAVVNSANTATSSALLASLHIKDPNSQLIAKGILQTIATALTIITTYVTSVGLTAQITLPVGFEFDHGMALSSLSGAKSEGLLPNTATESQVVQTLVKKKIVHFV